MTALSRISVSLPGEMFQAQELSLDQEELSLDQEELSLDQEELSLDRPGKSGQLFSDYCFSPRLSPRQMIMSLWSGQEKMKVMFCGQNGSKFSTKASDLQLLDCSSLYLEAQDDLLNEAMQAWNWDFCCL
ncbi:hypothetical protein WMY93_010357 [Mugilogobius chulae]|uniref:Uncharacterized protein n=1 Tax=Mugilogobius chulae TaxID=88201 RepID=A0AAW0P7A8_9GOBI